MSNCTSRSTRRATTSCCLQIMRALSGMLRTGVFYNRDKLYSRPEVRGVLREQHRAIVETILARDIAAAGEAASGHLLYTRAVLREIEEADTRLETSLRRIRGGQRRQPAAGRRSRRARSATTEGRSWRGAPGW